MQFVLSMFPPSPAVAGGIYEREREVHANANQAISSSSGSSSRRMSGTRRISRRTSRGASRRRGLELGGDIIR